MRARGAKIHVARIANMRLHTPNDIRSLHGMRVRTGDERIDGVAEPFPSRQRNDNAAHIADAQLGKKDNAGREALATIGLSGCHLRTPKNLPLSARKQRARLARSRRY